MSDYGRYGDTTYARRDRERDYRGGGRDHHRDDSRSMFGQGRFGGEGRWGESREQRGSRSSAYGGESRYGRDFDRDETYYGYDDYHRGLPIDETSRLIASNKVEGTPVYGRGGDRLGTIYNFMVDKRSGQVEYAVMSYGGFLGLGQRYYPLPWRILTYDTREGGYKVDMSERDLERAPSFDRNTEPNFDTAYGRHVYGWYGLDY